MQISIDAMTIEGKWFGPEPSMAPTIVMLHEGLGSVSTWRDFPQQLTEATGAGVFAYSRPAHGHSSSIKLPQPPDAMHREAQEVLPRILDEIGFRRGLLLGHSDGASIAAIYAGKVDDPRISGLVLIEPHFNVEEKNLDAIRQMIINYETTDLRTRLARHHSHVDTMFAAWSGMWLDPRFKTFDLTRELSQTVVPMLIVKSEDDPYSTMAQVHVAKAECRCRLEIAVIPGIGHAPHKDNSKPTLKAIVDFASGVL
jgi:pimeloyl-ACP methyl ester carboxylesterase